MIPLITILVIVGLGFWYMRIKRKQWRQKTFEEIVSILKEHGKEK